MLLKDYYPKLNKKYFNLKFDGISVNSKYIKKKLYILCNKRKQS